MRLGGTASAVAVALAAVLVLPASHAPAHAQPSSDGASAQGSGVTVGQDLRLLVKWQPAVDATQRGGILDDLAGRGVALERHVTAAVDALRVPTDEVDAVTATLDALSAVARVEPDRWLVHQQQHHPDDALFLQQWALRNDGQSVGGVPAVAGVDVRALDAWQVTRGVPEVVVAVIDGGVDLDHPDLRGAIWTNPDEVADGHDTDGNGYVDDVHGWNFVDDTPDVAVRAYHDWHGTAVTGVIAARADNGIGIAGLAPEVRVMPLKAFSSTADGIGRGTTAAVVEAFDYAVRMGADVINASWFNTIDSPLLREAVAAAGVPVVAAAGNNGDDLTDGTGTAYPAGYRLPNLVSVTAVKPDGSLPSFANTGRRHIDVGAPGAKIWTTSPGDWHLLDGTSFAAPFVAAAVALALSVEPGLPAEEVVDAVTWTSRVMPGTRETTVSRGMLDAAALLDGLRRPVCGWTPPASAPFVDVDLDDRFVADVACLVEQQVVRGGTDGRFQPDAALTRAQLASLLIRALEALDVELPADPPDAFADDDGSVHEPAINTLAALGIARGDRDGRFRPGGTVTRAQLTSFTVRVYEIASGRRPVASRSWFDDGARSTHAAAIDVARDLGMVRGVATLEFAPSETSRRGEVARVVARLLDATARAG